MSTSQQGSILHILPGLYQQSGPAPVHSEAASLFPLACVLGHFLFLVLTMPRVFQNKSVPLKVKSSSEKCASVYSAALCMWRGLG